MNDLQLAYLVFKQTDGTVEFRDMLGDGCIGPLSQSGALCPAEYFVKELMTCSKKGLKAPIRPYIYINPELPWKTLEENVQVFAHELLHISGWLLLPQIGPEPQIVPGDSPFNDSLEATAQYFYRQNAEPIPELRFAMKRMLDCAGKDFDGKQFKFQRAGIYCGDKPIAELPPSSRLESMVLQLKLFL